VGLFPRTISNRMAGLLAALIVSAFVMAAHGWSLKAGLFIDDHSHRAQLRESGWGYRDAVEASRLGIIGRVMYLWFKKEAGLHFYRPVSFWLMKIQYTLVRWDPTGMHGFSLAWHFTAAMLVYALAVKSNGNRFWATVTAALFAAHPGHVITVYWIACQTELMVVTFILSAVLCYARYSNWPTPIMADSAQLARQPELAGGHIGWLLFACLFFLLGLGCRENAIVFPAIAFTGDVLLRPRQWRRRTFAYALFGLLTLVYLLVRTKALGGFPMPPRAYMIPPGDPEFLSYIWVKFVYYLLGMFAYFPVLPFGGQVYFKDHPGLFYGTFAGVVVTWALLLVAFRRSRGFLLAPLWILLSLPPVIAVFACAHHLYLPSIGMVLMLAAGWAWLAGTFNPAGTPRNRAKDRFVLALLIVHGIALPTVSWAFGWIYRTSTLVEDLLVRDVVEQTPAIRSGDKLFFINMPVMAYYATPAIEEKLGVRNLRGYVLTFSPSIMTMEESCRIEQLDERTFSVSMAREGYFHGVMGKVLRDAVGRTELFKPGERIDCDEFETTVAECSDQGVSKLIFRFRKPLNSPDYHIYLGSRLWLAYPLTWQAATAPAVATTTRAGG